MDSWDVHPTGNTYFCKHGTSFGTQHENSFWAFCGLAKTTTWCGCLGRISPFDTVPSVHRYLLFTVKHSGSYPANILKPPVLLCIHRSEQRLYVYTTMCVRHAQKVCCFTYIKRCFIVTRTCQLWGYWHCQTGCCLASGCWSWTPHLCFLGVWKWSETHWTPHLRLQLWPGRKEGRGRGGANHRKLSHKYFRLRSF